MTSIYVGNLSYRANEGDVRKAFAEFGEVTSVNMVMDQDTGRSRGMAFVEMPSADEASAAIEGLNDREIVGRRVVVNEARPREERPRGGGGGGRYGGGGGRYGDSGGGGGGGGGRYGDSGGGGRYGVGGGNGGGGGGRYGGGGGGRDGDSGGRRGNYSRGDR